MDSQLFTTIQRDIGRGEGSEKESGSGHCTKIQASSLAEWYSKYVRHVLAEIQLFMCHRVNYSYSSSVFPGKKLGFFWCIY